MTDFLNNYFVIDRQMPPPPSLLTTPLHLRHETHSLDCYSTHGFYLTNGKLLSHCLKSIKKSNQPLWLDLNQNLWILGSSCTDLFTMTQDIFYCITLYTQISFHSKYEYQIHEYHQKEKLLEDKVVLNEGQYSENPLVILTIKKHDHLQYNSYGIIWQLIKKSFISCDSFWFTARFF